MFCRLMRNWWLDEWIDTFEEIGLALAIFADDDVYPGIEIVEDEFLIGFEVFEGDDVHC